MVGRLKNYAALGSAISIAAGTHVQKDRPPGYFDAIDEVASGRLDDRRGEKSAIGRIAGQRYAVAVQYDSGAALRTDRRATMRRPMDAQRIRLARATAAVIGAFHRELR